MPAITVNKAYHEKIRACADKEQCSQQTIAQKAVDVYLGMGKEPENKPASIESNKKVKGKIVKSKGMAHQHQDIDEITEQVRQKLQEKPAEKPKDERKLLQHDALDTRSKKVYCPGCTSMVDNPNYKKPTHKCADKSCGQLIPAAQGIEGTCPNCGADEFEELEDESEE